MGEGSDTADGNRLIQVTAGRNAIMLLPPRGRNIAYDLVGPETAPVVCMTHSLASDGGMWTEQVPPLLAAGFRVLRIDMRGHGGSGPVAGDYTMSALAADVAAVLDALSIARVHFIGLSIGGMLGQAFALEHGGKLASAMWCDTLPCHAGRCAGGLAAARRYGARRELAGAAGRSDDRALAHRCGASSAGRDAGSRSATRSSAPRRRAISAASRRSATSTSWRGCRR